MFPSCILQREPVFFFGKTVPSTQKAFQIQEPVRPKCFSIISPLLCHADSRLEQNGRCACVLREKGAREGERMGPGDGENESEKRGIGEVKPRCDAGTQSGASNSLPSKARR